MTVDFFTTYKEKTTKTRELLRRFGARPVFLTEDLSVRRVHVTPVGELVRFDRFTVTAETALKILELVNRDEYQGEM